MVTKYVNIIGAPGVGKSTQAALTFGLLKLNGINTELVVEYAKQCTWLENFKTLSNQFYVTAKQFYRQEMVDGLVDIVVTDSPLFVGILYGGKKCPDSFSQCVLDIFRMQNNFNIYLERGEYPYEQAGRTQTEEESRQIGENLKLFMDRNNIEYTVVESNGLATAQRIVSLTVQEINKG